MPNIASLLKAEIVRLARKEVRNEVGSMRKSSATHRREIAALKREVTALRKQAKGLARQASGSSRANAEAPEGSAPRFVAKGFRSMRARLGLSAAELATLLEVSPQSVYNWEHGKAAPRASQVAAIAALRPMGKKEARQRLEAAAGNAKPRRKRAKSKA
jgi:DNA-binding transcriptional regulator YiaG